MGRTVPLLRTVGERAFLADLANDLNLTSRAAELGAYRGEYAEQNLNRWRGVLYVLLDVWVVSDCVNGNLSNCVYDARSGRTFDKMAARGRMRRGGDRFKNPDGSPRYLMLQKSTLEAAKTFPDGHFDWLYLDATHSYAEAKRDLEAWYPKLRVGGLMSGHDYQFQHQAIGDGYTFGVRDAVDEFASARNTRVYMTSEPYLPSFYFLKCTVL